MFTLPDWSISALIFVFGFLLGFAIAFFLGLQNTDQVEQALNQTRAELQQVQKDIAELQETLRQERDERSVELKQLQTELKTELKPWIHCKKSWRKSGSMMQIN